MAVHTNPFTDLYDGRYVTGSPTTLLALGLVRALQGKCRRCGQVLPEADEHEIEHTGGCPLFFARFVMCRRCDRYHKLPSPGVPYESSDRMSLGIVLEPCASCLPIHW